MFDSYPALFYFRDSQDFKVAWHLRVLYLERPRYG